MKRALSDLPVLVQLLGAVLVVVAGAFLFGPAVALFGAGWGLVLGGTAAEAFRARAKAPAKPRPQPLRKAS